MMIHQSNPSPDLEVQAGQVRQLALDLANDPLKFIGICWPEMQIYD